MSKEYCKGILIESSKNEAVCEIQSNKLLSESQIRTLFGSTDMTVRGDGVFKGAAFYLGHSYDWYLVKDSRGEVCLVPTKK